MNDDATYAWLATEEGRRTVEDQLGRDPLQVALDRRVPHAAAVATQVKYLARAAAKLPAWHAARCVLPPRAFEQASSEACALRRRIGGGRLLDLTCGLGVEAAMLAGRFDRVVALERDPVLAGIVRANMRRMGIGNVEVVCAPAEEYLARTEERFDWIYADPDRRDAAGRRHVRLEACSPDLTALGPLVRRCSERLCVKNSPLFDAEELFARFGPCEAEAVSLDGECKELVAYVDGREARLTVAVLGAGSYSVPRDGAENRPTERPFEPERYGWLVVPDAALRKMRLACRALRGVADMWSNEGYGFAWEPPRGVLGRVLEIDRIEPYDPKRLRRELKGRGVELLRRDFPLRGEELAARLGVRAGDEARLAFTKIGSRLWTIRLKPLLL